jgi:BRCA1-associated protein
MRGYHIIITVDPKSSDTKAKGIQTFTPKHVFQRLPAHRPALSYRRQSIAREKKRDYRFGPLQIDWMDFETSNTALPSLSAGKEKEQRRGKQLGTFNFPRLDSEYHVHLSGPAEATFVPIQRSKSGNANLPEGIAHIFRDTGERPTPEQLAAKASKQVETEDSDGVTLGVLAVPSWMTPSDFLDFIKPAVDNIAHLRIIR